jgi:tRNA dimethylallyltransferase
MLPPLYLCGPTASGKSELGLALARALDGEIVNADAFQLYSGAPRVTAAPRPGDLAAVPHHLYAVLPPDAACDAMRFRQLAQPVIGEIQRRGRRPIVLGGSGLYLKFLTHGPSPLPPADPELRARLAARSLTSLVAELEQLDPVEAARTNLRNRRYVSRALEVCLLSGRPCSELRHHWHQSCQTLEGQLQGLRIERRRDDLHQRIQSRTEQMLAAGAIDEVAALPDRLAGLEKAIGIAQIRRHLAGEITFDACRQAIATATRQYAKRQQTWFRREKWLTSIEWAPDQPPPLAAALGALANSF